VPTSLLDSGFADGHDRPVSKPPSKASVAGAFSRAHDDRTYEWCACAAGVAAVLGERADPHLACYRCGGRGWYVPKPQPAFTYPSRASGRTFPGRFGGY